jgi:methionyl-tRNA synthetase
MTPTAKEVQLINAAHFLSTHPWLPFLLVPIAIWVVIWKGIALWRAARNGSLPWFVVLLAVNTLGILEIIYIFFFSKKKVQQ